MRWLVIAIAVVAGCKHDTAAPPPPSLEGDKQAVIAAMHHYDELVLAMNSPAIAQLFTTDGTIENGGKVMATGPTEILQFLGTFEGKVKVVSTASTVESVVVTGDRATATGRFAQTAQIVASGETVKVSGAFWAEWARDGAAWRAHHMTTAPDPK